MNAMTVMRWMHMRRDGVVSKLPLWACRAILWTLKHLICFRKYDKLVDVDYMERWHVIPRNRWFNIYFHRFIGSDAPTPHDHPWWSYSIILDGSYTEHVCGFHDDHHGELEDVPVVRQTGEITRREAEGLHWIEIDEPVYTLFITGRNVRTWGFQCKTRWFPWYEYVERRGNWRLANGCCED